MLKEWLRELTGRGRDDHARRELEPYLLDGDACVLLRLILENPGIGPDQLSQRSRLDGIVVEGCLNDMVLNGLVVAEKEGMRTGYHIAGAAKAAVAEHLPLNYQCPGILRE